MDNLFSRLAYLLILCSIMVGQPAMATNENGGPIPWTSLAKEFIETVKQGEKKQAHRLSLQDRITVDDFACHNCPDYLSLGRQVVRLLNPKHMTTKDDRRLSNKERDELQLELAKLEGLTYLEQRSLMTAKRDRGCSDARIREQVIDTWEDRQERQTTLITSSELPTKNLYSFFINTSGRRALYYRAKHQGEDIFIEVLLQKNHRPRISLYQLKPEKNQPQAMMVADPPTDKVTEKGPTPTGPRQKRKRKMWGKLYNQSQINPDGSGYYSLDYGVAVEQGDNGLPKRLLLMDVAHVESIELFGTHRIRHHSQVSSKGASVNIYIGQTSNSGNPLDEKIGEDERDVARINIETDGDQHQIKMDIPTHLSIPGYVGPEAHGMTTLGEDQITGNYHLTHGKSDWGTVQFHRSYDGDRHNLTHRSRLDDDSWMALELKKDNDADSTVWLKYHLDLGK